MNRLTAHSDFPCAALDAVAVEVARPDAGTLALRYVLCGRVADLRLPPSAPALRTDGLWKHTCLEAFIATADGGYCEFNFAPSGAWAAYRFDGYRAGMRDLDIAPPRIVFRASAHEAELTANIAAPAHAVRLGLAAVIEDADGAISYWALAHPPGRPDFHHPDGFALDLTTDIS
jgi:hypothetical protein